MFDIDSVLSVVEIVTALVNIAIYYKTSKHGTSIKSIENVLECVVEKMKQSDEDTV